MLKKTQVAIAVEAALVSSAGIVAFTTDAVSYAFRMPAGFPGDVNRTHPASIVPGLLNTSIQSPRLYGDPCVIDPATNSYRGITAADTATFAAAGILVRPYPTQQTSGGMAATTGIGAPAANQPNDFINDGYVMAKCNVGTPTKNGAVYVYTGTSTGSHVQGGMEAAAGANLTLISNLFWNGPPDAGGVTEVRIVPASS